MAELTQVTFTHKEVAEALVRHYGLHEGIWGLYIEFGIQGANLGPTPLEVNPVAIVPVQKIGLQRFPELNSLSVDAAVANPKK
ncbi:MAG: hypothetical protein ACHQPI_01895 [Thermoanaerobaculia bacterium]